MPIKIHSCGGQKRFLIFAADKIHFYLKLIENSYDSNAENRNIEIKNVERSENRGKNANVPRQWNRSEANEMSYAP